MAALPPEADKFLQDNWGFLTASIEATRSEMRQQGPLAYLLFDLTDPAAYEAAAMIGEGGLRNVGQGQAAIDEFLETLAETRAENPRHITCVIAEFAERAFGAPKCPADGSFILVLMTAGSYWVQTMKPRRPKEN